MKSGVFSIYFGTFHKLKNLNKSIVLKNKVFLFIYFYALTYLHTNVFMSMLLSNTHVTEGSWKSLRCHISEGGKGKHARKL